MPKFFRTVHIKVGETEELRKVLEVEVETKVEADPILDKMAELYALKLRGESPLGVAKKLKSVAVEQPQTIDPKMLKLLKGIGK